MSTRARTASPNVMDAALRGRGGEDWAIPEGDALAVDDLEDPLIRTRRVRILPLVAAARASRGASGGRTRGGSSEGIEQGLLGDAELREIEERHRDGITAVQVVDIFAARGLRFSEATFRKYVQQGLLPRSRRVGRKGKHRGSLGVYPARTVRRVNAIKQLMADGYTIEEIQEQFLRYTDVIESLEEGLSQVFTQLERESEGPRFDARTRRSFQHDLGEARKSADELLRRIEGMSRRVAAPREDRFRTAGAAGSAEELL